MNIMLCVTYTVFLLDVTGRVSYPVTNVSITPNEFVLMEKTSRLVTIMFQPLQETALKCQEGSHTAAHLAIYSGDEVLRRSYRR